MQKSRPPHSWTVTPQEAIAIQRRLARSVSQEKFSHPLRYIAGVDTAFSRDDSRCLAGVVLWDNTNVEVVERHTTSERLTACSATARASPIRGVAAAPPISA